jgi:hypothetical protein
MKRSWPWVLGSAVLLSGSLVSVTVFDVNLSDVWIKPEETEATKNDPPPDLSNMTDSLRHLQDDLRRIHKHLEQVPPEPLPERNSVLTITPGELAKRMRGLGGEASDVFKRDYRGHELTWSAQLVDVSNNDGLFRTSDGESFWARFEQSNARNLALVPIGSTIDIQVTLDLWYIDMLYVTDCRLP